jgi:hypothetical protein
MLVPALFATFLANAGVTPAPGGAAAPAVPPAALPSAPPAGAPPRVYRLRERDDRKVEYDSPAFAAVIDRDGSVVFEDHHGFGSLVLFVMPTALPEGTPTLEGSVRDLLGRKRRKADALVLQRSLPPGGALLELCEGRGCRTPYALMTALGGTFDISDEILRSLGEDPYAAEKARFLAATSAWRLERARRYRVHRARVALGDLDGQLARVWADRRFVASERRRLLFDLWLEMDASSDGKQGAATIEAFIQRTLPAGSPDAYTTRELEALNRLAAPRRFVPQ